MFDYELTKPKPTHNADKHRHQCQSQPCKHDHIDYCTHCSEFYCLDCNENSQELSKLVSGRMEDRFSDYQELADYLCEDLIGKQYRFEVRNQDR